MSVIANNSYRRILGVAALAASLMSSSFSAALAARTVRLDAGTVLPVRLNDTISSSDSRKGDSFTTTVKTDDSSESYGLPSGTKIEGIVQGVRPMKDNDPGMLDVSFQRVRLPDGHSYAIDGSLIGLDNKSVDRKSDGRLVAKPSHRNDRLTWVGYGAGAGLIVGLVTKHTLEDTLLGGLLGYGAGALQKGHSNARDVVLKPGTELGVRLDRRATLTTYDDQDARYYRDSDNGSRVSTDRRDYDRERSDYGTADLSDRSDVGVMVDDTDVRFDSTARPIINSRGVVLVPAIPVLRSAHVPYTYDSTTRTLKATGTENPVRITLGSSIAVVNGSRRVRMEAQAQRLNGTVYVPMKFLSLATGYDVSYDSGSKTVILSSR